GCDNRAGGFPFCMKQKTLDVPKFTLWHASYVCLSADALL
ncbi:hypothetical protein HMPREF1981_01913, partial [Bacteroides pyogenes F0041]